MRTELATVNGNGGAVAVQRSSQDVVAMTHLVQEVMHSVMKKDHHYGLIPGCGDKPTLLKPGAEKLCMTFRLAAMPEVFQTDMGNGHREYRVSCKLVHIPTSEVWGVGIGICSTMESKYRWRGGGRKCPQCGKAAIIKGKKEYGGGWLCFKKKDGCDAKFPDNSPEAKEFEKSDAKVENPDIADTYNTVLKMAKKRAVVDATLTATAASDIFTQDIEELAEAMVGAEPPAPLNPPPAQRDTPKKDEKPQTSKMRLKRIAKSWTGLPAEDCLSALNDMAERNKLPAPKEMTEEQCGILADWIEKQVEAEVSWTDYARSK